jgi:hypothetical protein
MKVLVAGSYPPVPGAATAATLAAVHAAWAAGDDVTVISPRPSAADGYAHLAGWRAVAALARLSRGHHRLVLVAEPGVPFGPDAGVASAAALARTVRRRFDRLTLRLVSPAQLPVAPWAAMWRVAAVTPGGPAEWTGREQPRRLASMVIRRVLGRHTDAVRGRAVSVVTALRAHREGRRGGP